MIKQALTMLLLALATGCASSTMQPGGPASLVPNVHPAAHRGVGSTPIQHVIVIFQENRSFDNLFNGFPGANTVATGQGQNGKTFTLQKIPLTWPKDLRHDHPQFLEDFDGGKADGFQNQIRGFKKCRDPLNHPACWLFYENPTMQQMAYSYVDPQQLQPYWALARQYALGDNMFSSNSGPSFVSHQYLVAGQSNHSSEVPDGMPWGCDADPSETVELLAYGSAKPPVFSPQTGHEIGGPFPCFTYNSAANLLDAAKITWRYYVMSAPKDGSSLSSFEAISQVRHGPDWANVVHPDTAVLSDIANGKLQQVSWVMPSGSDSDHAGHGSGNKGPDWVASIVNAVGTSQYWPNTAIIVMWDEWGGWYDHVAPQQLADPVTGAYEGLGFRVPLIVVSPYAKSGYISHQPHEIASSLRFIENTFNLGSLGLADARADGLGDMFNFLLPPTKFTPIPTKHNAQYFLHMHDTAAPDTD